MSVDLKLTTVDVADLFKTMTELDEQYARSINGYMCSDFCICPGLPTDSWYKEYKAVPEPMYNKYDRTFLDFDGNINLARFGDPNAKKPLFWTYDPSTLKAKDELVKLSSKSMVECLDNIENIAKAY